MNEVPGNESAKAPQELRERLRSLGYALYEGPVPFDELPFPPCPNEDDYTWAFNNQELHRLYQRMVVAVHRRKVWGVGKNCQAAWEDARQKPGCPEQDDLAFVDIWGMPGTPNGSDENGKQE